MISQGLLEELVPIENAAMEDRTVIEWDKDDLDDLGLLKVDVLGLGMLSALRRGLELVADFRRKPFGLADIPREDPRVYEMISRADTIGVFQVESRAQMSMLPRLQPREFYDLVIEVAIVRPGPIQGGMVHPYLRRRQGLEPVTYPSEAVKGVLSNARWACPSSRNRSCSSPSSRRDSRRAKPISCAGAWRRGSAAAASGTSSGGSSKACARAAMTRVSRARSSARSRASASTAFRNHTPRVLRCWCTAPPG